MSRRVFPILVSCLFGVAAFADELPYDVTQAKGRYQKSIEVATQRYLDELSKIQSRAFMLRDTKAVAEVTGEINKVLVGTMVGKWQDVEDGVLYINPNGTTLHSNGAVGTWVISESNLLLTWNNGAKHIFPIVKTADSLKGKRLDPGESFEQTLKRLD